jgi:hypothetical protein
MQRTVCQMLFYLDMYQTGFSLQTLQEGNFEYNNHTGQPGVEPMEIQGSSVENKLE